MGYTIPTFDKRRFGESSSVLREWFNQPFEQSPKIGITPVQIQNVSVWPLGSDLVEFFFLSSLIYDQSPDPVHPAILDKHVDQRRPLEYRRCHSSAVSPAFWEGVGRWSEVMDFGVTLPTLNRVKITISNKSLTCKHVGVNANIRNSGQDHFKNLRHNSKTVTM